jgi:mannose-6-phosphate isomerase
MIASFNLEEMLKLIPRVVEKPWGRTDLPSGFGGPFSSPIGEVWFEHPDAKDLPLLVKYIFTSEKLSVQVHPDDQHALERGLVRGKNECWYILEADQGAALGLGLKSEVSREELRASASDGSIEQLLDWRSVKPGEFYYVPAGTIHAIGAGITLLEVQQNSDVTYRLYDYGRPRELHLDDGIAVSEPCEYQNTNARPAGGPVDTVLVDAPSFSLVRTSSIGEIPSEMAYRRRWIMPLDGQVTSNGVTAGAGECLLLAPDAPLSFIDAGSALIAAR